ncbi:MAG: glycosyltransferase family 4 protein [Candidatus Paceibacteria bacterium]
MSRLNVVDQPADIKRKIHQQAKPLGGGIAIFLAFFLSICTAYYTGVIGSVISLDHILALVIGGAIITIGGFLDDVYRFSYYPQLIAPVLASLVVIGFSIGPEAVTNPFGGVFRLDNITLSFGPIENWVLLSDLVVFVWLMGVMFTTKLLDGLDGLVSGIVAIGAVVIFFLTLQPQWFQPEMSIVSIILAASMLGFLVWNWHPAKIFLGESGSLLAGFLLGSLAILSGAKIATGLLVLGVPMLDMIRVVIRRAQKDQHIFVGDKEHLHFKLLRSGLNQRQAVLLFYAISFLFGISTIFLQSKHKLIALLFLLVLMLIIGAWFSKQDQNNEN